VGRGRALHPAVLPFVVMMCFLVFSGGRSWDSWGCWRATIQAPSGLWQLDFWQAVSSEGWAGATNRGPEEFEFGFGFGGGCTEQEQILR